MTERNDLIAELESNFDLLPPDGSRPLAKDEKTAILEELTTAGGKVLQLHIAYYYDEARANKYNAQLYVLEPGTANETAQWMNNNSPVPKAPVVNQFRTGVQAAIDAKIKDGTIEAANVVGWDDGNKRAKVQVALDRNGKIAEKLVIVYDDNGKLRLKG